MHKTRYFMWSTDDQAVLFPEVNFSVTESVRSSLIVATPTDPCFELIVNFHFKTRIQANPTIRHIYDVGTYATNNLTGRSDG